MEPSLLEADAQVREAAFLAALRPILIRDGLTGVGYLIEKELTAMGDSLAESGDAASAARYYDASRDTGDYLRHVANDSML